MGFLKEFKTFAMKGNVVDLAVALIIGAEFGKIVSSLVKDVIMPPIGQLMSGLDFSNLYFALDGKDYESLAAAHEAGAPLLTYGNFIQAVVNFVVVAFAVFLIIKAMNAAKKKEEAAPAAPAPTPEDIQLLREIRDSLKK
ncbi:MAG: large conductance mechanosensitive channel protein MscL [Bacteroidota bacterium]|nr:large conductance mechanosensitive channel protein MscL [Bacteroidota bacterium]MDX5430837.1 large conductance mechanosensitive channel protein MscL [Bacteroidota bacterium]MDX5469581.1 large conductance mechanosensitive channel protein MscL [Bacteroidota bacterium]